MNKILKIMLWSLAVIILVGGAAIFAQHMKKNAASDLSTSCEMIFSPDCQEYLNKITKDKRYDEAIHIQERRIDENLNVLNHSESQIMDKKWLAMTASDAEKEFQKLSAELAKINKGEQKKDENGAPLFESFEKDYNLLQHNNMIIRDITLDTMIVATIQRKELKDYNAAIKTLEKGRKILDENKYFVLYDDYMKMIERGIEKNKKLLNK